MKKDKDDKNSEPDDNDSEVGPGFSPNFGIHGFSEEYLKNLMTLVSPSPVTQEMSNQLLEELQRPGGGRPQRFEELFAHIGEVARQLSFADDSLPELIAKLKSTDYEVRLQVVKRLQVKDKSELDKRLVEPLIVALADPSYQIRYSVPHILQKIGDTRAVKPLVNLLYDPDFNIRNSARVALGGFGKTAIPDLLETLDTPDPSIRHTIVTLLGESRDERALPALEEIARNDEGTDPYGGPVKDAAARAIRHIKPPERKKRLRKPANLTPEETAEYDWRILLTEWSAALLESNDLNDEPPPEAIEKGWLGYPGATEEQIQQAEERLGTKLPPSYRAFLKVTNGWPQITTFIYNMWSAEEVEWFRVRNEEWALIWNENNYEIPDEEYFVYNENQSPDFRTEYLLTALEISDVGDSCIFLLNPQVVTPEGEWEAWFFANWIPGARRYRSFWEMMQAEYKSFLELQNSLLPVIPTHSPGISIQWLLGLCYCPTGRRLRGFATE